jgi:hypothetical protein
MRCFGKGGEVASVMVLSPVISGNDPAWRLLYNLSKLKFVSGNKGDKGKYKTKFRKSENEWRYG